MLGRTSYFLFSTELQARRFVYLVAANYRQVALCRDDSSVYLIDGTDHDRSPLFSAIAQSVRSARVVD